MDPNTIVDSSDINLIIPPNVSGSGKMVKKTDGSDVATAPNGAKHISIMNNPLTNGPLTLANGAIDKADDSEKADADVPDDSKVALTLIMIDI